MEWEYAARGGTNSKYFFMEDPDSWAEAEIHLDAYAWFNKNSQGSTQPVGQKKPNPYGLYDMYGNVWEWVEDRFAVKSPSFSEITDYKGPAASPWNDRERVFRGGSFGLSGTYSRSGSRRSLTPNYRHNDIGFRLALSAE
jgi:formylglycine-generating enzyme required for sulfatase activity